MKQFIRLTHNSLSALKRLLPVLLLALSLPAMAQDDDNLFTSFRLYIGPNAMAARSDYMDTPHGFDTGFEFIQNRHHLMFDMELGFGTCQKDIQARYGDILKGNDYQVTFFQLCYGHEAISKQHFQLVPYIGIGGGGIEDNEECYEEWENYPMRGAFKASLGACIDILFKDLRQKNRFFTGTGLRIRPSYDFNAFRKIGVNPTFNLSVTWYWDFFDI